jgi:3-mercaptopyruvate sulfurtransferase SseA
MQKAKLWTLTLAAGLLLVFLWGCGGGENAPRLERNTLKSWLSDPQVIIIDVRAPQDWDGSKKKIKGAQRRDLKEIKTWAATLPKNKKIVFYCA